MYSARVSYIWRISRWSLAQGQQTLRSNALKMNGEGRMTKRACRIWCLYLLRNHCKNCKTRNAIRCTRLKIVSPASILLLSLTTVPVSPTHLSGIPAYDVSHILTTVAFMRTCFTTMDRHHLRCSSHTSHTSDHPLHPHYVFLHRHRPMEGQECRHHRSW